VKLKICGITTLEDARFCSGGGADFLGFVQHEASPRYVSPQVAKGIIEWVYGSEAVGVFVNEAPDDVNRICDEAGFGWAQLHGEEPPFVCQQVERPVIKALHVGPETTADALRFQLLDYQDSVELFLLDTKQTGLWGGTGTPFDWDVAAALAEEFDFLLAGGIGPGNLEEAVRRVGPYGVDLSSSVETAPGRKDFDALRRLFDLRYDLEAD
jgi:phosphoribosylanthranilate isomerase